MSNFNNDKSGVHNGSYYAIATADEDDDADGDGDVCRGHSESNDRNQTGRGSNKRNFQKPKQIVRLFSFRKKGEKKKREVVTMQSNHGNGGKSVSGCFLCLKQPQTYESAAASGVVVMSDDDDDDDGVKNDIDFLRYESVKILVEGNQFYDKDCNTHVSFVSLHPD